MSKIPTLKYWFTQFLISHYFYITGSVNILRTEIHSVVEIKHFTSGKNIFRSGFIDYLILPFILTKPTIIIYLDEHRIL